jgi:hypothetical protein
VKRTNLRSSRLSLHQPQRQSRVNKNHNAEAGGRGISCVYKTAASGTAHRGGGTDGILNRDLVRDQRCQGAVAQVARLLTLSCRNCNCNRTTNFKLTDIPKPFVLCNHLLYKLRAPPYQKPCNCSFHHDHMTVPHRAYSVSCHLLCSAHGSSWLQ